MVYLTCAVIGLGGRGVIKTWTEVAARVCLFMLTSYLTSVSSAIQPLAASEESWHRFSAIIYDRITIMGYNKHELSTINLLYSLKLLSSYHPTSR